MSLVLLTLLFASIRFAPEPCSAPAPAAMTRQEADEVLRCAGWPDELRPEALQVAWGESRWRPGAENGVMTGLFQMEAGTWAPWCGVSRETLFDAHTNAACALRVYGYYQRTSGYGWQGWEVRPFTSGR